MRAKAEHPKRKPLPRIRYEESHPVVSFRVKRELYQELKDVLAKSGKSIADVFREALVVQKASVGNAYQRGYRKGYEEAINLYRVSYPCSICRETIEVTTQKQQEAVAQHVSEHRWGHGSCHEKRRQGGY